MEWIKTARKLPEYGKGVLILLNTGLMTVSYRKEKNIGYDWQLFGDTEGSLVVGMFDYVEYWMPLPEPPCDSNPTNSKPANCAIFDVSQQREQLSDFRKWYNKFEIFMPPISEKSINSYLKSLNCG